jgi:phosphoglycerate dehydrogenase-like enzyme
MGEILLNVGRWNDPFHAVLLERLRSERITVWPTDDPAPDADILATLYDDVEQAMLPSVGWVHCFGAGLDGFPLGSVGARVMTCGKGATSVPIAEYVMAVMLAFEKQLPAQWLAEPPAIWNEPSPGPLGGLSGATMALIGVGAIGTEVAKRALAFDMRVLAHRRSDAPLPLAGMQRAATLREALGEADHIVVTAPSTPATYHLIGEESLRWVKPGAHLVNVARGALVDSTALLAALDDGRIARASLDVAEGEPLPEGDPLYRHPGVRLTPHISHSSHRYPNRSIDIFVENVHRWRAGAPLEGVVDPTVGY